MTTTQELVITLPSHMRGLIDLLQDTQVFWRSLHLARGNIITI